MHDCSPRLLIVALIIAPTVFAPSYADEEIRHGLNMELFSDMNLKNKVEQQVTPNIDFNWYYAAPTENVPADNFSLRLSGWIRAPKDGQYKIHLSHDNGAKVWINGQLVLDAWKKANPQTAFVVPLTEKPQTIGVEFHDQEGRARLSMLWQPVGAELDSIIPPEAFFSDQNSAESKSRRKANEDAGLKVQYFDASLKRQLVSGYAPRLETHWARGAATFGVPANAGARYSGFLIPPVTGRYRMIGWGDDFLRVWIDGKPILDYKFKRGGVGAVGFVDLDAGKASEIRVDFADGQYDGGWYLHWIPPGGKTEVSIPSERLFQTRKAAEASELLNIK